MIVLIMNNTRKLASLIFFLLAIMGISVSCRATFSSGLATESVTLPFMKNTANECYYLDEFMPVPDGLVSGRNGALNLRYYSYKTASYKDWKNVQIHLAFYSPDNRCWSLFEEYYSSDIN